MHYMYITCVSYLIPIIITELTNLITYICCNNWTGVAYTNVLVIINDETYLIACYNNWFDMLNYGIL